MYMFNLVYSAHLLISLHTFKEDVCMHSIWFYWSFICPWYSIFYLFDSVFRRYDMVSNVNWHHYISNLHAQLYCWMWERNASLVSYCLTSIYNFVWLKFSCFYVRFLFSLSICSFSYLKVRLSFSLSICSFSYLNVRLMFSLAICSLSCLTIRLLV